jgi:hypothetical protein
MSPERRRFVNRPRDDPDQTLDNFHGTTAAMLGAFGEIRRTCKL